MTRIFDVHTLTDAQKSEIARALSEGAVAVFPTDTVYGIGTGAFCEESTQKIYQLKNRPATQPLQILTASVEQAQSVAIFNEAARKLASAYWPGALTLILPPSEKGKNLTRGFAGLGLRVPKYPPLTDILAQMMMPISSTSANLHGQPVLTDEREVLSAFAQKVDIIIKGGFLSPTASSVVDLTGKNPVLLREGALSKTDLEHILQEPLTRRG